MSAGFTTATLRDGRTVKVMIEPGVEQPATRTALVALLSGAAQVIGGHAKSDYRDDVLTRIRRALAAERGARVLVLAIAVLLGGAVSVQAASGDGACTPVSAAWSSADAEGHLSVELSIPGQPWRDVTAPRSEVFCLDFTPGPGSLRITKVRTFWATDRGHIAEARLHVLVRDFQLVARSEHKEVSGIYDGWKSERTDYLVTAPSTLYVQAAGWPTTAAPATMQFGVIVEMTWTAGGVR